MIFSFKFALYRSRKLNTLLENAIQEAMAELDKKTENRDKSEEDGVPMDLIETPRRKTKIKKHRKNAAKVDGTRLRSSR